MLKSSDILTASILIVDDLEANVQLLERMLRNAGYTRISSTNDPRQVCELHREHRYDLILLDLNMPEMDGFEVMAGLQTIDPSSYLPVLVITAQPGHKLRALQAGAKDFISKPFELVEVQTRIHNMLEVRLLYSQLDQANKVLERTVQERTAELRASEARFRRFTELSSDWYWEQDAHGNVTDFGGPAFDMLGIAVAPDAPGSTFTGTWNEAERALLDANIAGRRPFLDLVYSRVGADGAVQYLQVSGEPMFDSSSRFAGYRGIGMDVTERMRPNRMQERFRAAIDALGLGVLLIARSGMRIVDANDAACRLSGHEREQLLKLDPDALGLGEVDQLMARFDALIGGAASSPHPVAMRLAVGGSLSVTLEWRAVPQGEDWLMVGAIHA